MEYSSSWNLLNKEMHFFSCILVLHHICHLVTGNNLQTYNIFNIQKLDKGEIQHATGLSVNLLSKVVEGHQHRSSLEL